jgi:hypothetical protein
MIGAVRPVQALAIALVSVFAACGGATSEATVACTTGSGSTKTCVEYSIPSSTSAEAIQGQNDACLSAGGVASSACSHVGADGGCRVKSTASGATQTVTTWVYAGNAANEKLACTSNGQTWIAP